MACWAMLIRNLKHRRIVITVALMILIPVAAIVWWLGSPLFITKEVQEEFPFAASAVVPRDMTRSEVESTMAVMAMMDSQVEEVMPAKMSEASAAPVELKAGSFRDADRFHTGSGVAKIFRAPDGSFLLRLEDFRVTNGPDLRVILSPHPNPEGRGDVTAEGYVEVGKLKGNVGNQNYPIPAEADISALNSVVIYCKPFHVIFSVAPLEEGGG